MADARDDGMTDEPLQGAPRWVKVLAIAAGVVAAVLLILLLSGVEHGPGRHQQQSANPWPALAAIRG